MEVGEQLPELTIELTPTLIIASAIATRDFQDVHHDLGLARERGMPNIFMNILSSNGFVGRYVTDWAGPEATVRSIAIRLGAPNFPDDVMTMQGRVTAAGIKDGKGMVEVEVRGSNSLGDHVTGKVVVDLPVSAPAG